MDASPLLVVERILSLFISGKKKQPRSTAIVNWLEFFQCPVPLFSGTLPYGNRSCDLSLPWNVMALGPPPYGNRSCDSSLPWNVMALGPPPYGNRSCDLSLPWSVMALGPPPYGNRSCDSSLPWSVMALGPPPYGNRSCDSPLPWSVMALGPPLELSSLWWSCHNLSLLAHGLVGLSGSAVGKKQSQKFLLLKWYS